MNGIEIPDTESDLLTEPGALETGWFRQRINGIRYALIRLRRRLPYLVWYGEEVDVGVTLKGIGAIGGDPQCVFEVQMLLNKMGILFDTGSGCHGRDWEWDFSLKGPISVRFRSRTKHPERRELSKPNLSLVEN